MKEYHRPVMLEESISLLSLRDKGIYVDATLGGGGHSSTILKANSTVSLYSFDRDKEAVAYSRHLESHNRKDSSTEKDAGSSAVRIKIFNDNFVNIRSRLALERITKVDGILFDLGVSFSQISSSERGMSFDLDGRLDMRMNQEDELTAYDVINGYSVEEIARIIWEYGEERESNRIARGIDRRRRIKPLETTLELSEVIDRSTRSAYKIKAKARVFQGLRIFINGELEALKTALCESVELLNEGGRLVVISYHSLEDRIVKQFFVREEKDCICPAKFPKCICDKKQRLKIITKKPITPSATEVSENRQSRSAKLRAAERVKESERPN